MAQAKTKGILGNFATFLNVGVVESTANTLTYEKIESGMSIYDRIGWVISRIEWSIPSSAQNLLLDQDDLIQFGLSTSNAMATITDTDPNVLARNQLQLHKFGAAASGWPMFMPQTIDYSTLPNGGILTLPNPLYVFARGHSLAGPVTVNMRAWFTSVDLADDDYFLLAQARMLLNQ